MYVCCVCVLIHPIFHDSLDGIPLFFYLLVSLKGEFGSCSHFDVLYIIFKYLGCFKDLRLSLEIKTKLLRDNRKRDVMGRPVAIR